MEDTDGVLSFNGEIYNYLELKKFKFGEYNTQSDTSFFKVFGKKIVCHKII